MNNKLLNNIPTTEPTFTLRARDKGAALALHFYMEHIVDDRFKQLVGARLDEFLRFSQDNPDKMKAAG
jgi:hypothetical protein